MRPTFLMRSELEKRNQQRREDELRAKLLELLNWFDKVKDHGATSWTREDSQRLEAMRALAVLP